MNQIGAEGSIPEMCQGRTIPLCQDDTQQKVEERWKVTYRDVVILDPLGRPAAVYNLTKHGLGRTTAYDSLKAMILEIANR
jgi:hypothetical protein